MPPKASTSNSDRPSRTAGQAQPKKRVASKSPPPLRDRTKKRQRKGPLPHAGNPYRLREADIAKRAISLKTAISLHIRVLWELFDAAAIPDQPPQDVIEEFNRRFTNPDELHTLLTLPVPTLNISNKVRAVRSAALEKGCNIAYDIGRMDDQHIDTIFRAVTRAHLISWRPDLFGSVDSPYNAAHEAIAVTTFKQVVAMKCYLWIRPDLSYLDEEEGSFFIEKIYRHFVFYYHRGNLMLERRNPGAVKKRIEKSYMYERRMKLSSDREDFCKSEGLPPRVQRLFGEPQCSSDDEDMNVPGTNESGYVVKKLINRCPIVRDFARLVDNGIKAERALHPKRGARKTRNRVILDDNDAPESQFNRLPKNIPIDWIEPAFYNSLPVSIRARYKPASVILPTREAINGLAVDGHVSWASLKIILMMPRAEFMETYGRQKAELYHYPTDEELAGAAADPNDEEYFYDADYDFADGEDEVPPQQPPPDEQGNQGEEMEEN